MNKSIILSLYWLFFLFFSIGAQRRNINSDWEFQRLNKVQNHSKIKNQGSDWSSQYNVEHVNGQVSELAVSPDTLSFEFSLLARGQWESITLPHTPFVEKLVVLHQWQGVCYYRKKLKIEKKEENQQLWIEFEGAMHLADVWINGKHVMQHAGGYTPFVVDATGLLKEGELNDILVRLDNRNNPLIPPGKPLDALDFCYYGGIYRDVSLIVKPKLHITHPIMADQQAGGGVFVTYPQVSKQKATVCVQLQVANKEGKAKNIDLRYRLYEWKNGRGKKITEIRKEVSINDAALTDTCLLEVEQPRLWYPDSPALYLLTTEIMEGNRVIDTEKTRIGIRHLEMTHDKGFLINGEPLKLVGTNRHMEYPYVGNAISDRAQYRDMYQIRSNGFNVVRLGHYPQDPSVLDACDELGLMVIEPIPGWQFFNKDLRFVERTYKDVRDLIRRDRNHPSIIIWETTLNESWPPNEWKDGAIRAAHEEYPGNQCFTAGDAYGYNGFDVCYNDWEEGFNRPNKTTKPGFIREYYDYEFGGHYSTTRVCRGDGDRALSQNAWNAQWSYNRYNAYYPHTMGSAVWSMHDYNRGCCDNICHSGTADIFRLPKFSLSFFRSQLLAGDFLPKGKMPYEVFLATHWLKGSSDTIQVYGNVDEVELLLNGKSLGRQRPDKGADTPYIPRPDKGNCRNLVSPPFTFTGIAWQVGELKAVGYNKGNPVAEHAVQTPGVLSKLGISYFESGVPASIDDLLIVYVRLLDSKNVLVFADNATMVNLEVVEGGAVLGEASVSAEAGIASFIVKTGMKKRLILKASTPSGMEVKQVIPLTRKNNCF